MEVRRIMDAIQQIAREHLAEILDELGEHFVMGEVERWLWDQAQANHEAVIAEMETYGP